MVTGRPAALVSTCDQWVRATHHRTAVEGSGELLLSWSETAVAPAAFGDCRARGLATDRLCRIYRVLEDRITRTAVGPTADGLDYGAIPEPIDLIGPPPAREPVGGAFAHPPADPLGDMVGIAIDDDDRLFLSDASTGTIAVVDLWSRRLLRRIALGTSRNPRRTPAGLASDGKTVYAVVQEPAGLVEFSATRGPVERALPMVGVPDGSTPHRVALLHDGHPVVLFNDPSGMGWLAAPGIVARRLGAVSDIAVQYDENTGKDYVVVAPCAGPDDRTTLRRFSPVGERWNREQPFDATGYDGNGLVVTLDGRIGYFRNDGRFRLAVGTPVRYETSGHCITYRLDSEVARNRWGRILIEACVPDGTTIVVGAVSSDDEFASAVAHNPAEPAACEPSTPDPGPLPPALLVPTGVGADEVSSPLHRRPKPVTPWWTVAGEYHTFEAPVIAEPGRYLWVTIGLRGNQRRTPRVREVRVERQAHGLMRRLPALYSDDAAQEQFLHRYLALADGFLHDLELQSRCRDLLVDPEGAPAEALDWLGSFVGLVLDPRWAEEARRRLIREIVPLYRYRGTTWALARYMEIYLMGEHALDPQWRPVQPIIVEHYRLRGLGGPLLSSDPTSSSRSVLGAGLRVGGAVGELGSRPLDPEADGTTSFESHAHRFTVLIPQPLGAENEAAIRHILDTERPAHTAYDLCTGEAGIRVGDGLHLGLSSIVGPTGAFESALTDRSLIGRGAILGGPSTGVAVEAARIGATARVG